MHLILSSIVQILVLFCSLSRASDYGIYEDEFGIYDCSGINCPQTRISVYPVTAKSLGETNITCKGSREDVFPDSEDCHSFYICSDDGKAIKMACPKGYGFHAEWELCVPEHKVKACKVVYCPPYIYDGVVPDTKNCRAYYRCVDEYVFHYRCPVKSTFDPESGTCKHYKNEPECLKNSNGDSTTTTTTPTTTTMNTSTTPTTTSQTTDASTSTTSQIPPITESTIATSQTPPVEETTSTTPSTIAV